MKPADLLVEIGTEELPPTALRGLMEAFAANVGSALDSDRLGHGEIHAYASPRRLAVIVEDLERRQPDQHTTQKGPPVDVAFDANGKPQAPALAFARKCGVDVDDLVRSKTPKGEWLTAEIVEKGRVAGELLPGLVERALGELPIPRRMRWGAGDAEFVRPVHWVVLLHGTKIVEGSVMGLPTGRRSRGHRFLSGREISIAKPSAYLDTLEEKGSVIADFGRRRDLVERGVRSLAKKSGGSALTTDELLDEVTALVEWPVPMAGHFDEQYLELPREVVVSTLTGHQRYFPVVGASGELLSTFVFVSNLESEDPDKVRDGNERVIRPRLADAAFFWDSDRRLPLAAREEGLRDVVYQRGLGSLYDKSARVAALATDIAGMLGRDANAVARAAMLAKCDLLTGMVGEFPELQGVMGRYYAASDGEPAAVAEAIGEHYHPRYAGDALPATDGGQVLAIADKLDTLAGVFAIGKKPTGNRDPFGLRRSALGIIRITIECELELDLGVLIERAVPMQPAPKSPAPELATEIYDFITDRLRRYALDRDPELDVETFEAVIARRPSSLVDFDLRLEAVQSFLALDEAASLAAANKRIANILRQAGNPDTGDVQEKLLVDAAEVALWEALGAAADNVRPLLDDRRYADVLRELAGLREFVDEFFDGVMVMVDDVATRDNRLALLGHLRALFLDVADISRLSIASK